MNPDNRRFGESNYQPDWGILNRRRLYLFGGAVIMAIMTCAGLQWLYESRNDSPPEPTPQPQGLVGVFPTMESVVGETTLPSNLPPGVFTVEFNGATLLCMELNTPNYGYPHYYDSNQQRVNSVFDAYRQIGVNGTKYVNDFVDGAWQYVELNEENWDLVYQMANKREACIRKNGQ